MPAAPPFPVADPLGEALHVLRMDGVFYCRSELTEPWGMTLPATPGCLWFHVVTSGGCRLTADGADHVLRPGELVLVPHGAGHVLRSAPGVLAPDIRSIPHPVLGGRFALLRHGGDGPATRMVCGAVRFGHPAARDLVDRLPGLVRVESSPRGDRVQDTLRLIAAEVEDGGPGSDAVITRLADVLVIQAVRGRLEADDGARTGWLGALADERIGHALAAVHRAPERDWTVATLAATAAMSRSAFAARFTELVGEPAMTYVTRWRMNTAVDVLSGGDATVAEVARRFGYRSEAAFARAFARVVGEPAGRVRRRAAARGPAGLEVFAEPV
ncbi:AraC family transcriptional regulator [Pseudonocardia parietis]|uniref:AraC-like DNA-binding protein n=1 Tax=Pseudonocardia parietis TaxID=570936 RepID=A0ABS4VNC0_9PSEU|nr:AraC family transcriptional regulator [Pseudonocardia parietis]MBP2365258.1 AraC-like DNA-binding protein [Pseudonocardia parietis]